jgi:hypothetical protein
MRSVRCSVTTSFSQLYAVEMEITQSSYSTNTIAPIGQQCNVQDYPPITYGPYTMTRSDVNDRYRMGTTYRHLLMAPTQDLQFRINVTKYANEFCDFSFVPPPQCAPYLTFPGGCGGIGYGSRVNESIDLFAAIYPNEVASNTACYRSFLNMTCLSVIEQRCDPVSGVISRVAGHELCVDRCVRLLTSSCGFLTRANAFTICSPIQYNCEYSYMNPPAPVAAGAPTAPRAPAAPASPIPGPNPVAGPGSTTSAATPNRLSAGFVVGFLVASLCILF